MGLEYKCNKCQGATTKPERLIEVFVPGRRDRVLVAVSHNALIPSMDDLVLCNKCLAEALITSEGDARKRASGFVQK